MQITVLDLGSSSFHAQTFAVDAAGQFVTRFDERRQLRLGSDVYSTGRIGEDKWHQALCAVGEMLDQRAVRDSDITVAVATSALRDAANGLAFRVELWNRHRLGVQLLTPEQEARFTYLGATTTPQVGGRRVAVLDLGGGSLEVAVGGGTRCTYADSLPIGALNVRAQLDARPLDTRAIGLVHDIVRHVGRNTFAQVRNQSPELIVFASGTARAARHMAMAGSTHPGKVGTLSAATLRHVIDQRALQGVDSLSPDETSVVAGSIMLAALDMLDVDHAVVSDKGLRDGVALDVYRRAPRPELSVSSRLWNRRLAALESVPANLARRD